MKDAMHMHSRGSRIQFFFFFKKKKKISILVESGQLDLVKFRIPGDAWWTNPMWGRWGCMEQPRACWFAGTRVEPRLFLSFGILASPSSAKTVFSRDWGAWDNGAAPWVNRGAPDAHSCKGSLWGGRSERGPTPAPTWSHFLFPHSHLAFVPSWFPVTKGWLSSFEAGVWSTLVCWEEPFSYPWAKAQPLGPVLSVPVPSAPARFPCLRFTSVAKQRGCSRWLSSHQKPNNRKDAWWHPGASDGIFVHRNPQSKISLDCFCTR